MTGLADWIINRLPGVDRPVREREHESKRLLEQSMRVCDRKKKTKRKRKKERKWESKRE